MGSYIGDHYELWISHLAGFVSLHGLLSEIFTLLIQLFRYLIDQITGISGHLRLEHIGEKLYNSKNSEY